MKLRFKKILLAVFVAFNIFSLVISPALAWDVFDLGNPLAVEKKILDDLGVNKEELRNIIQTVNVARRKINPPMLSLTFDPTDPVPGEKVTATAMPNYFLNVTEDLYFTWYLKNEKCTDEHDDDYKYNSDCDLDDDNEVNINDYKIKAMRILANDDFAWDKTPDPYLIHNDDDGYQSVSGGDDQRGKSAHCFIHDVDSGDEYELGGCGETEDGHLFPRPPDNHVTGDNAFGLSEEKFWRTDPENNDTSDTGNTDEANVAGLGENEFTFTYTTGDKIGVVVEGVSIQPTQYPDSSYKTMWAFTNNKCDVELDDNDSYPKTTGPTAVTHEDTDFDQTDLTNTNFPLITAVDYTTTVTTTTVKSIVSGSQVNDSATIRTKNTILYHAIYTDPNTNLITDPSQPDYTRYTSTCPEGLYTTGGVQGTLTEDGITYTCIGTDEINQSNRMTLMTVQDLNECLYDNLVTPSEGGGATEKLDVALKYLPENPSNDASGNDNGDTLSLTASVLNATNISYLNYTWEVFASDEPNPDSWGDKLEDLSDASQDLGLGLETFKFNLNFQPSAFIATNEIPKYLKIKVTVNDTLAENGKEREGHTDVVVPIFSSKERIEVYTAKAYVESDNHDVPIISLSADDPPLERCLFVDPENQSETPKSTCEVAKHELIAMNVENESDKYTDFVWTIDGKTHICPANNFYNCLDDEGKATERTYFPVLKNPGDRYTVDFSMLDTATGDRINLSRVFEVLVPEAKIVPKEKDPPDSDNYICRGLLLGKYTDFYGAYYDDRSTQKFQALTGHNLELYPVFSGTEELRVCSDRNDCPYQWNVDGITVTANNATDYGYGIDLEDYGKLILPPKNDGEQYLVSFATTFTPLDITKRILNLYWDVTYDEFYEKRLTDSVQIEMVSTDPIAQKNTTPKKIFATLSSGIPNYIAFLFRIVLSGMAMIFALKLIFFIIPKRQV